MVRLVTLKRCQRLMDEKIKSRDVRDVEADEVWGFCFKKEGHKLPEEKNAAHLGDAYCFIGMERSTKLVLAWHLGKRNRVATDSVPLETDHATVAAGRNTKAAMASVANKP